MALLHGAIPLGAVMGLYVIIGLGFGSVASPTFSSIYRVLPGADAAQATTAIFVAIQLFASAGVTVTELIFQRAGNNAFTLAFAILSGALVTAGVLGSLLPGRLAVTSRAS